MSITDERRSAVDFTSGYYTAAQTVITTAGSPIDGATTLADLKGAKLGAQVGERLDHVAARHLDDPYAWWRFADAQPGVDVDDLDRTGHWLPLPRRGG